MRRTIGSGLVAVLLVAMVSGDQVAQAAPERIDYLTFAQGAVPLRVVSGTAQGVTMEKAIRAVDGASSAFGLSLKTLPADGIVEFLYVLPAMTTFDRFAVPAIVETPSPSTTFTRRVEVEGSAEGPDAGCRYRRKAPNCHQQR
ncbi:MAG: hypothetical protein AMXMBFR57_05590 [Acidimicrobiia bacterium]